jgi:hypothetical protein
MGIRHLSDGLAALVREQLKQDPFSGTIFIFRSKRAADRLKILAWDGSGLVLLWKRIAAAPVLTLVSVPIAAVSAAAPDPILAPYITLRLSGVSSLG